MTTATLTRVQPHAIAFITITTIRLASSSPAWTRRCLCLLSRSQPFNRIAISISPTSFALPGTLDLCRSRVHEQEDKTLPRGREKSSMPASTGRSMEARLCFPPTATPREKPRVSQDIHLKTSPIVFLPQITGDEHHAKSQSSRRCSQCYPRPYVLPSPTSTTDHLVIAPVPRAGGRYAAAGHQ